MPDSLFVVTTEATDKTLLSISELRAAVGVNNQTSDVQLTALGKRVSDRVARICGVRAYGAIQPTLRKERITETFRRFDRRTDWNCGMPQLVLSRRPIVAIVSVTEDGASLASSDYEISSDRALTRLSSGGFYYWNAMTTVVVYDAGWDTVPNDLKFAAEQLARAWWFQNSRDPALRQLSVPGVIEETYWVGSSSDPDVPQSVMDTLTPYMNLAV